MTTTNPRFALAEWAYEQDRKKTPNYHDGKPRPPFAKLPAYARTSWSMPWYPVIRDDGTIDRRYRIHVAYTGNPETGGPSYVATFDGDDLGYFSELEAAKAATLTHNENRLAILA